MNYADRQAQLRHVLDTHKCDAFLVTHAANIRYLCGFTGSACALVISAKSNQFFTDGRYTEQAREQVQGARIRIGRKPAMAEAAAWLSRSRAKAVGIEADHLTISSERQLRKLLPSARLRPTSGVVERLRLLKDKDELLLIRDAVFVGSSLLSAALMAIRPGVRETEVAGAIELAARKAGADGMSFETIVAAGSRSALPHGRASTAPIPANGFVVLDFGVILHGYCSDMTRTVRVGACRGVARRLYQAVREAQEAAIAAVRPGVPAAEVDWAARKVLKRAGLDRYFTHSTGHGVGLEIHEPPRIGRGQTELLQPGMVITIEPGAYVPGQGGVRIEDMVVVTAGGCEVLTTAPKELIEL